MVERFRASYWEKTFVKHFSARLVFYEYSAASKSPMQRKHLASLAIDHVQLTFVGKQRNDKIKV